MAVESFIFRCNQGVYYVAGDITIFNIAPVSPFGIIFPHEGTILCIYFRGLEYRGVLQVIN